MIEAEWREYDDPAEFAEAVAGAVGGIVDSAVEARGVALLALPGGSTPRPIFAKLAEAPLPWSKVTLIPTDDRLVDAASDLSNARLLTESFLRSGARVCPIATANPDLKLAGSTADARLQELPWPPDLVWLGMGEDGHTASIFAGPDLDEALNASTGRRAVGVRPDPLPAEAPVPRVTLTKAAILEAKAMLISVVGEKKKALLQQALADGHSSRLPIGRVLADLKQPIAIHWCRA